MRFPALLTLLLPVLCLSGPADAEPATRVISLAPHTTELVIAAGGQSRLIAAVPADAKLLPPTRALNVIGGLDREMILRLNPDLAIAWRTGNRASDIAWLHNQGIRVYLSEPTDMARIAADIRAIGRLLGTDGQARAAARAFMRDSLTECAQLPGQEVYIEVWNHPAMTIGGRHWLNDALSRVNLKNTWRNIERPVFSVDREALLAKADLPVVSLRDGRPLGSRLLGRPGPLLASAIQRLCEQRLHMSQAGMAPR